MKYFFCIILLILLSCNDENENPSFSGITETDQEGNIIGTVDSDDWKPFRRNPTSSDTSTTLYNSSPGYAYPNPSDSLFVIHYNIPISSSISISVWESESIKIKQIVLNESVEPGSYNRLLSLQGYKTGVYRVKYELSANGKIYSSYGDIKIR